jgi:hypothetical protein
MVDVTPHQPLTSRNTQSMLASAVRESCTPSPLMMKHSRFDVVLRCNQACRTSLDSTLLALPRGSTPTSGERYVNPRNLGNSTSVP